MSTNLALLFPLSTARLCQFSTSKNGCRVLGLLLLNLVLLNPLLLLLLLSIQIPSRSAFPFSLSPSLRFGLPTSLTLGLVHSHSIVQLVFAVYVCIFGPCLDLWCVQFPCPSIPPSWVSYPEGKAKVPEIPFVDFPIVYLTVFRRNTWVGKQHQRPSNRLAVEQPAQPAVSSTLPDSWFLVFHFIQYVL